MSSWAEEVRQYKSRKTAPLEMPSIQRHVRKDPHGRSHVNRDFNIVTNNVGNREFAATMGASEAQRVSDHVNKAIEKHLTTSYHGYNIVTMDPAYGISNESCNAMGGNQEPKGKKMAHNLTAAIENKKQRDLEDEARSRPKVKKPRNVRDANIVSHRYYKDHDSRKAVEMAKQQARVEAVSANTNEFNPLTGRYYKIQQETLAQAEHDYAERKMKEEVQDHTYKTSGIVERSEGHAFDIVTNHVYNKDKILKLEQQTMKGIPQRANLRLQWDYQRDVEEALRDADVTRSLNRMSDQRTVEVQRRGYNALTNEPIKVNKASSAWQKVRVKPALEKLHDSMGTKSMVTSEVLRENGPRTTNERVFQTPASGVASHVASFKGRAELLVPSVNRVLGQPLTGFAP